MSYACEHMPSSCTLERSKQTNRRGPDGRICKKSIEKYNEEREEGDDQFKKQIREQQQNYVKWREDMEDRVKANPPIFGSPIKVESRLIRKGLHDEAQKTLKKQSIQYFKEMREFNESLNERKPQDWVSQPRPNRDQHSSPGPGGASAQMTSPPTHSREYETFLEDTYRSHSRRVRDSRRALAAETRELEERDEARAATSTKLATFGRGKLDAEDLQERMNARPRTHGGYVPVVKSDKRLRNEEADKAGLSMAHSLSAPTLSP